VLLNHIDADVLAPLKFKYPLPFVNQVPAVSGKLVIFAAVLGYQLEPGH
jgi:hypothetical protein